MREKERQSLLQLKDSNFRQCMHSTIRTRKYWQTGFAWDLLSCSFSPALSHVCLRPRGLTSHSLHNSKWIGKSHEACLTETTKERTIEFHFRECANIKVRQIKRPLQETKKQQMISLLFSRTQTCSRSIHRSVQKLQPQQSLKKESPLLDPWLSEYAGALVWLANSMLLFAHLFTPSIRRHLLFISP